VCAGVARAAPGDGWLAFAKLAAPTSGSNAEIGSGNLGVSVALSADGSTAIAGAFQDDGEAGAAYVFVRSGAGWALQTRLSPPTSGSGKAIGNSDFGATVAISADGNTALIGGFRDNSMVGAAWVYVRSGTSWSRQKKLLAPTTGTDEETGAGEFGSDVALSADGNTAMIAGIGDNAFAGAVWSFTRSGTTWSEQHKLLAPATGADAEVGKGEFGAALSLTPDGQNAVISGDGDNNNTGAAWVFTNSAGTWPEQARLIAPTTGPDAAVGATAFGTGVALSADGGTALIGAQGDNTAVGAGWIFSRLGTVWSEQAKLVAPTTGADAEVGAGFAGASVALSPDGATAIVGAVADSVGVGAAFQFSRSAGGWVIAHKLTAPAGADAESGAAQFGTSLAFSGDGQTLLIGGYADDSNRGAVWSFAATSPPAVSSLTPATGPTGGGTQVVINGTGFAATGLDATSSVTFAGVPPASFEVVSPTQIDAVAPPHAAGLADVIVSSPAGTSAISPADQFAYVAAPAAPTKPTATAGNGRATVSFTPPPGAGSALSYVATASPGGAHASATVGPITITGLANGTTYTFTITATDAGGTSPESAASNKVTPFAPPRASKASIEGVAQRAPMLAVTLSAGKSSPKLKSIAISLPHGLSFAKHKLSAHVLVGGKPVRGSVNVKHGVLTVILKHPASKLSLKITSPGLSASASLANTVKHKHGSKQSFGFRLGDAARNTAALELKLALR
jgi:hypothetical protein